MSAPKWIPTRQCCCKDLNCNNKPINHHTFDSWACPSIGNGNEATTLYRLNNNVKAAEDDTVEALKI